MKARIRVHKAHNINDDARKKTTPVVPVTVSIPLLSLIISGFIVISVTPEW